jgi:MFS family permease
MAAGAAPRLLTPEFWVLMAASSLFFLGSGALNALLPRFVVDALDGTELTAGIVMGAMAISALLARPWFGRLADRRGARRLIVLGAGFATVSLLLLAAFPSVPGAIVSRLFLGAGAAAVVTGSTLLSIELAPDARRSEAASYVLISFHVGMGLGPIGGEALLGFLTYGQVWLVLAAVIAVGGVVAGRLQHLQLRANDYVEQVKAALQDGASPPAIDIELTESLVMEDIENNLGKLRQLCALGLRIAIDDFGTGYSSLGYLAKFPVHTLKIDRSFIITMLDDPDTMALVSTIISLARSLRLTVVAEGVDHEDQAKLVRLLRCDQMQGYLFSKPVPFADIVTLLHHQQATERGSS